MRMRNQTEDHHQMKINRHTFGLIGVDQMSERLHWVSLYASNVKKGVYMSD